MSLAAALQAGGGGGRAGTRAKPARTATDGGGGGGAALAAPALAAPAPAAPAWAGPHPANGTLPLGTVSEATNALWTRDLVTLIIAKVAEMGWAHTQGGYIVVEMSNSGDKVGLVALCDEVAAFKELIESVIVDVAGALRVPRERVNMRFLKLDAPCSGLGRTLTCDHALHPDAAGDAQLRVVVSFTACVEGERGGFKPSEFFAGAGPSKSVARMRLSFCDLHSGDMNGQLPATGFHGTRGQGLRTVRLAVVFDVDLLEHRIPLSAEVYLPIAVAGLHRLPLEISVDTLTVLQTISLSAPQTRRTAAAAWRGWLGWQQIRHLERILEIGGTLSKEEAEKLAKHRVDLKKKGECVVVCVLSPAFPPLGPSPTPHTHPHPTPHTPCPPHFTRRQELW